MPKFILKETCLLEKFYKLRFQLFCKHLYMSKIIRNAFYKVKESKNKKTNSFF